MRPRLALSTLVLLLSALPSFFASAPCAGALPLGAPEPQATLAGPTAIAVGDFNADGKVDTVVACRGANAVSVLIGNGNGGFVGRTDYGTGRAPESVAVGDFNGDGDQDFAVADNNTLRIDLYLGNGTGGFSYGGFVLIGWSATSVAVGDFNGDSRQDLVATNYGDNTVSILLGNGHGGFSRTDFAAGASPTRAAVGDFDGDGKLDVAVSDAGSNSVSILVGNGDGTFAPPVGYAAGLYPKYVAVGDFNGDGKADLVTADYSSSTVSVLLGAGDGTFATAVAYATGPGPTCVAVGALTADGRQDLAVANSVDGTVSILIGDGAGAFTAVAGAAGGTGARGLAFADFDRDGSLDVATADSGANTVSVLLNEWGATSINGGAATTSGRIVRIDSAVDGATQMRLRDQGGVWTGWQDSVSYAYWTLPAGDGQKTVEAQYLVGGLESPPRSASILLDSTAPQTTDDAPAAWQAGPAVPVGVTLTADDGAGSGVAATQYKVDGATTWTSGATIRLSADGQHTIRYRSIDAAGNVEETQYTTVRIDGESPDVGLAGVDGAWHRGPVMALIGAADGVSGVGSVGYELDGAGWLAGGGVLVSGDGVHTLDYGATDNAGNTVERLVRVKIDATAPATTDDAPATWTNQAATVHLSASDALSGMRDGAATTEYSIDGGATWVSGTTLTIRPDYVRHATDGLALLYRSIDAAGNAESACACQIRMDTRRPSTLAWPARTARHKRTVFWFEVADRSPCGSTTSATRMVQIRISNARGKLVRTITAAAPCATNAPVSLAWPRCTLNRGTYSYVVVATDEAGNVPVKAGRATLVVR